MQCRAVQCLGGGPGYGDLVSRRRLLPVVDATICVALTEAIDESRGTVAIRTVYDTYLTLKSRTDVRIV